MFKLGAVKTGVNPGDQKAGDKKAVSTILHKRGWGYFLDIAIVVLMGGILFWGAASQFYNQYNDVHRYQCYAAAFWHGTPGLSSLPQKQCAFLQASSSASIVHLLSAASSCRSVSRFIPSPRCLTRSMSTGARFAVTSPAAVKP